MDDTKEIAIIFGMGFGALLLIILGAMIADSYNNIVQRDMMIACVQSDMQWIEGDCVKND